MLTLGQAARLTGTSKTTLTRAIKGGRLSATRNDDGSYTIDPAELSRVYRVTVETPATVAATGDVARDATPARDPHATPDTRALEAEIEGLKAQLAIMREYTAQQIDELKHQRDAWQEQATSAQRLLEHQAPRRGWFGLRRAG